MLQRILTIIRQKRIRKHLTKAINSTNGIEKVNQKYLMYIVDGLSKRLSISLYKKVRVVDSIQKPVYVYNKEGKGKIHAHLRVGIAYQKGCCESEQLVLKNPRGYWQIIISTEDKLGNIRIQKPVDALIYLGLAKPKH